MKKINTKTIALSGLVGLTCVSGFWLSSSTVSADDVVDNITIKVPIACTMAGSGMNSHITSITNGSYRPNIGSTTIKVMCNDASGFSIYATGYTNGTVGADISNKLQGTAASDNDTIVTGLATSAGDPDVSNWAMKLTAASGANVNFPLTIISDAEGSFSNYHTVPSDYAKVATRLAGTDVGTNAEGSTLTTTYAAYISQAQIADTYSGTVKYVLVHPNDRNVPGKTQITPAGKIGYYPNAFGVEDTMADQELTNLDKKDWSSCAYSTDYETSCVLYPSPDGEKGIDYINNLPELDHYETTLWASNFRREGYGFAGWNTEPDYSGTSYGPNERISLPESVATEQGLSLYAMWVESSGSMQDFTQAQCSNMPVNQVVALTDNRDNNTYAIAKLPDNKCWMIENLRLANESTISGTTSPVTLSTTNTNNPSLPLENFGGTTSNSLSASATPSAWCDSNSFDCVDQSMLNTENITNDDIMTTPKSKVYSYGNYYNWYSATAGNGVYNTSSNTSVDGSICPKNWRMSSGPNGGDYDELRIALGINQDPTFYIYKSDKFWQYPINYVNSGTISSGQFNYKDSFYWTETSGTVYMEYRLASVLSLSSSVLSTGSQTTKYVGATVRCIAAPSN
ncbi:hypothetical protein IKF92_00595 [Candidatus Saccharibacteria bacterium]|nr:hypothetical protein [Candidatus Saccharibacteria bacterium]